MDIYVKISLISIFYPFSGFQSWFFIYIYFTHVTASDTATDNVTN